MGKRGKKPQGKIACIWSEGLAYAVGLLVTDGCLYNNGRMMNLTSSDREQLVTFKKCLGISNKICRKRSGFTHKPTCEFVQFGDVSFYAFLLGIGLTPAKSKTMGAIEVPDEFFFDYLRGVFDGDGTFYSYWDKRWKSSFMFYLNFVSASRKHIDWLRERIEGLIGIRGHITRGNGIWSLRYAKQESLAIIQKMYHSKGIPRLSRKYLKVKRVLATIGQQIT